MIKCIYKNFDLVLDCKCYGVWSLSQRQKYHVSAWSQMCFVCITLEFIIPLKLKGLGDIEEHVPPNNIHILTVV